MTLVLSVLAVSAALTASVTLLLRFLERKDERQAEERRELYQRIQAPEVAVAERAAENGEMVEPVGIFDDREYWAARGVADGETDHAAATGIT